MAYVSQNGLHDSINKATTDLFTFAYKHVIKPDLVFNHTPDIAHDQMIRFCQITGKMPPLMWLCRTMLNYTDPILETNVMGINFANPFGLSAGLDKNCDMAAVLDHAGFGFETVGSTTSRPCAGNPRPWFHRLPEYDSNDGARGPGQRWFRRRDRTRRRCLAAHAEHAAERCRSHARTTTRWAI